MSKYIATVIKTGNSFALRVPKQYVVDAKLQLGQKVMIPLSTASSTQNRSRIQDLLKELRSTTVYGDISHPSTWQHEVRKDRPLPGRVE